LVEPGDDPSSARSRLASRLRQLRVEAGLSTTGLASAVGLSQGKISKIENAQQSIRREHVEGWLRATGVSGAERSGLLALAEEALVEASSWWREHRTGLRSKQLKLARLEGRATRIRQFEPGVVPGLAQTPDYAGAMLRFSNVTSQGDAAAAVQARMDRQAVLYSGTAVELLIGEIALRWAPPGQPHIRAGQLDRLMQLTRASRVRLGLVPADSPSPPQLTGFTIYDSGDERTVTCETYTGEVTYQDPRAVEFYVEVFEQLSAIALFDERARDLIRQLIEDA